MLRVIGFYTKNTPYEQEAKAMVKSAKLHGADDVVLFPVPSTGRWERNCQLKTLIIMSALEQFRSPLLYVDSDARFLKYPKLIETLQEENTADFAYHLYRDNELLSGTLWFNYTSNTQKLVAMWLKENRNCPNTWDQITLSRALAKCPDTKVHLLPPEYTWIYDLSKKYYGELDPVICHYQASRKYKRGKL